MLLAAVATRAIVANGTYFGQITIDQLPLYGQFLFLFAVVNLFLGLFNLLADPAARRRPRSSSARCPAKYLETWYKIRPYGILVLFLLVFSTRSGRAGCSTRSSCGCSTSSAARDTTCPRSRPSRHAVRHVAVRARARTRPRSRGCARILTPAELALWRSMSRADRAGVGRDAAAAAERHRGRPDAWAAAALLHDVGKTGAGLGTVGRALATARGSGRRPGPGRRAGGRLPPPRRARRRDAPAGRAPVPKWWRGPARTTTRSTGPPG